MEEEGPGIGGLAADFTLKKTGATMAPCPKEDCRHFRTWPLRADRATGEMVSPEEPDVPCRFCNKWQGFNFYRPADRT
jgi:hypothetical protein